MILAAGRGRRMRTLTNTCPKPLLKVLGKPLLRYHIDKLVGMGIVDIVINHAYLGEQIVDYVGDGSDFGASIRLSAEPDGPYETAGGIAHALPLLAEPDGQPFLVVNGDVWTDYDFALCSTPLDTALAHLILVANPEHHKQGDFALDEQGVVHQQGVEKYTFSGIGLYQPALFCNLPHDRLGLGAVLRQVMDQGLVTGSVYQGYWTDVGTPERLQQLNQQLTVTQKRAQRG